MNPTPVAPISSGVQLMPNQQQEMLPEEFEAQLAGYLNKEKPSTIHKEISDSKETTEEETNEDKTDEILTLDSPLFYTGPFNVRPEQQPTKGTASVSEQPVEVNQLLNSSDPIFTAQVAVETEKIDAVAVVQNEDVLSDTQKTPFVAPSIEPLLKEDNEVQTHLKSQTSMIEEPVEIEKNVVSKPTVVREPINRRQEETLVKDAATLLVKETHLIELDQTQVTAKENELTESILPTGRFLTAEWKNERVAANQIISEPIDRTGNLLSEVSSETVQTIGTSEATADNGQLQQPKFDTIENKFKVLMEPVVKETSLKNPVSQNESKNSEAVTQVAEWDGQGKPIQQQPIFEAASVKQPSVVEPVRQAVIQMVNEVVLEQAETVLSGKQSVAHVTVTPEKMGEVKITVELTDNVLLTKIVVDNFETRELLTNGMHRLTDNLDRQNIRLGELTIQMNENTTAGFTSQERQGEEQNSRFRQQQTNYSNKEIETLKTEEKKDTDTSRLSILV